MLRETSACSQRGKLGRMQKSFHGSALRLCLTVALLQTLAPAHAAPPSARQLDRVQVSGQRIPLTHFPGAVSILAGERLRDGQRQVSLAETLSSVPGVIALERHNFAQDLQLQSRGFGARSSFGIRGLTLITDGIPASALDGQGQASGFALSMLDRIEVLRGPLALQYGNAAGGALVGESVLGEDDALRVQGWLGTHGSRRTALRADTATGPWRARVGMARFATAGHRPHSTARRDEGHAILQWQPEAHHDVQLVADALRQPDTDDPLGLTPAQWRSDPDTTDAAALAYDTRKRIDQRQAGLRWRWRHGAGRETRVALWHVQRDIEQFLAIPAAVQAAPTHAGGVVAPERRSSGLSIAHRREHARGAWTVGVDRGRLHETRRGYENFVGSRLGVRGRLRRHERNRIDSREAWASGELRIEPGWSMLAALRHGRLRFQSRDRFIAAGNGDDSGRLDYAENAFSAGIARRFAGGEVFASLGRGYETPTLNELAYRADGNGGFNFALQAARFGSAEVGIRWRGDGFDGSLAAYRIEGRDEIVQLLSSGGRSSFANAARTRRDGLEAGLEAELHPRLSLQAVANLIDARHRQGWDGVVLRGGAREVLGIAAGHPIAGIPRWAGSLALDWHALDRALGLRMEINGRGGLPTDDRGSAAAPGHALVALALRWRHPDQPGWHAFARIDNAFDRRAVGSVIVNEANGRSFEPAPGRTFTLGIGWQGTRGADVGNVR